MSAYPLYLNLKDHTVLVAGAGAVGQRKIARLIQSLPAKTIVMDPALSDPALYKKVQALFSDNYKHDFSLLSQAFSPEFLEGASLVFAATNNYAINEDIVLACKERKILCNKADSYGTEGDFTVPASIEDGDISLCISTGGASPALARHLRMDLEERLTKRYTVLAKIMKELRPHILALELPTEDNAKIFRELVNSDFADHIEKKQLRDAEELLKIILPYQLEYLAIKVLNDI